MRSSTMISAAGFLAAFFGGLGFTGGNLSLELGASLLMGGLVVGVSFGVYRLSRPYPGY